MSNFKIHDFTQGSTNLIDWKPGDYTVHDYGRGSLEVGIIMDNGRIYGISDEIVPAEVWDFIDSKNTPEPIEEGLAMEMFRDYINSLPAEAGW